MVSPLLLCPAAGGVLELSGVFGGRLSFSRSVAFSAFSVAFSRSKAPKRASNCAINASFSLALSKLKSDGEFIPLSIQIRRRPATPFRTCDSIRRTTGSSAPMQAINHLPARDVSNYQYCDWSYFVCRSP